MPGDDYFPDDYFDPGYYNEKDVSPFEPEHDERNGEMPITKTKKSEKLKPTQLVVAQWEGNSGLTYSLFALNAKGEVFQRNGRSKGWIPIDMRINHEEGF